MSLGSIFIFSDLQGKITTRHMELNASFIQHMYKQLQHKAELKALDQMISTMPVCEEESTLDHLKSYFISLLKFLICKDITNGTLDEKWFALLRKVERSCIWRGLGSPTDGLTSDAAAVQSAIWNYIEVLRLDSNESYAIDTLIVSGNGGRNKLFLGPSIEMGNGTKSILGHKLGGALLENPERGVQVSMFQKRSEWWRGHPSKSFTGKSAVFGNIQNMRSGFLRGLFADDKGVNLPDCLPINNTGLGKEEDETDPLYEQQLKDDEDDKLEDDTIFLFICVCLCCFGACSLVSSSLERTESSSTAAVALKISSILPLALVFICSWIRFDTPTLKLMRLILAGLLIMSTLLLFIFLFCHPL